MISLTMLSVFCCWLIRGSDAAEGIALLEARGGRVSESLCQWMNVGRGPMPERRTNA